ncbi:hypothetical protein ACOMICROBIO_FLGHMIGD_03422 [Vibrio sp. B1FLJ16]|nr:hypothetical protein ACOMICROBIO_FLGHMIGD_03422 [Vibrio sp. B1FLJ16]CAE6930530.1 hypothetical protein ACOMICROBIO_FLGHMIGD_03422 [Vibrio sp. B1FLJ16]
MFVFNQDIPMEDLGEGISRKVLAHSDNMMSVEVHFEEGAIGPMHSHPHEQLTYVLSGEFEFTIGDEKKNRQSWRHYVQTARHRARLCMSESGCSYRYIHPNA